MSLASKTNPRQSPSPLPGTPSIHRHSAFPEHRSHSASLPTLLAEKQTVSPLPNTLNLLDSWKHRNISTGIRPASSHSSVSKSSRRIRIVEQEELSENDDFNPPTIRIRFPDPRTNRGRFRMSKTSPHSCLSRRFQFCEEEEPLFILAIAQEKSFHWLRHGDPTSHKA